MSFKNSRPGVSSHSSRENWIPVRVQVPIRILVRAPAPIPIRILVRAQAPIRIQVHVQVPSAAPLPLGPVQNL